MQYRNVIAYVNVVLLLQLILSHPSLIDNTLTNATNFTILYCVISALYTIKINQSVSTEIRVEFIKLVEFNSMQFNSTQFDSIPLQSINRDPNKLTLTYNIMHHR